MITNECMYNQVQILSKVNSKLQAKKNGSSSTQSLINCIYSALKELHKQFFNYNIKLLNLRKFYKLHT